MIIIKCNKKLNIDNIKIVLHFISKSKSDFEGAEPMQQVSGWRWRPSSKRRVWVQSAAAVFHQNPLNEHTDPPPAPSPSFSTSKQQLNAKLHTFPDALFAHLWTSVIPHGFNVQAQIHISFHPDISS